MDQAKMPQFQSSTILKCSAQALREFLGQPSNLPSVSDPELELQIVAAPEVISEGDTIEFLVSAYGFKQRATHRYETVTDSEIIEVQIDGPMRSWKHRHCYEIVDECTCKLVDEFEFDPPGGMLGFLLTAEKIIASLEDGMRARYESLAEILEPR
jgi:ligand-binding SRPBCC domain-containing protein